MANYMNWVLTSGHQQALQAYNDWVYGPNPINTPEQPLFVNGIIGSPAVREESATINTGDLIIVHVIGANYILGDTDSKGNPINTDTEIMQACQHSAENEDFIGSVEFKAEHDPNWTDLTGGVQEVSMTPVNFTADPSNPYLNDWDFPMPPGEHKGAWASKLLLLQIPEPGVFELRSHGKGIPPFEQNTYFKIKVQ
jgi:hypothetical protein